MKIHPLLAASVSLLIGVIALGATAIVEHRRARAHRPPPPAEVEDTPVAPRRLAPVVARAAPPRRASAPPAPAPRFALRVHVVGPHGIALEGTEATVHRRGDDEDDWTALDPEEAAADAGSAAEAPAIWAGRDLPPGRYDLRVEAPGMRELRVDDVRPGDKVIEVALARRPTLLGAVGALGTTGCAGVKVRWSAADGEETGDADVDEDDCTFVAEGVADAGPVTVVAQKGDRRDSALVTPPLAGDPAPLCLAPPCAELPAALVVYVADAAHREVDDATITWTLLADELQGAMGTSMGSGELVIRGRRPGQTLALHAERAGHAVETTVVVGSAVTEVVLTLPPDAREPVAADDAP